MKSKLLGLLAVVLLTGPMGASATVVARQFEFQSTAGALQFGPTIGTFSYDDSVAPVGGGYVNAVGLFSDLSVSFAGFSFDETTANSGWLRFDSAGDLLEAHFGTDCVAGTCFVVSGQNWWIRVGLPDFSANDFTYSGYLGQTNLQQTFLNRLITQVPEPGTLALLGLGLLGLGVTRRKAA